MRQAPAIFIAAASAAVLPVVANAQADDDEVVNVDEAAAITDASGTVTYPVDFFATYNPITALDMVRRVPGFSIDDGDDRRGFGATAGNVLINGERPSRKGDVSGQLGRIAAANVERIELIRGASGDIDVRGQSVLVNVVLVEGADGGSTTTWRAQNRFHRGGRISPTGEISRTFTVGAFDITLGAEVESWGGRSDRDERRFDPVALEETRDRFGQEFWRALPLTADVTWRPGANDTVNLNANVQPWRWSFDERSDVLDAAGAPLRFDFGSIRETDGLDYEFGGDWEHAFSDRHSIKLVGLISAFGFDSAQAFETFTPTAFEDATTVDIERSGGERIGRGSWTWRPNDSHTIETGLEGAFNFLENALAIAVDDGSGPVPLDLPVANTRVEELRGEAFVTDVWSVNERVTLEGGFTFEASRITQTGDGAQERTLSFPKPRVSLSYARENGDQFRFTFERDVDQLDFDQFASSVSISDGSTDLGNPNLEPERTWRAEAEWERRFGERGALTLTGFYDQVESVADLIPIVDPGPPPRTFDAPGNIGDGVRYGFEIEGQAPLDWIGLSNATLETEIRVQESRVDDPVTGEERPISDEVDWRYYFEFRQDVPAWDFVWGGDYYREGEVPIFRSGELRTFSMGHGDLDLFVETTRFSGMTLRFGVDNILNPTFYRQRVFFSGTRAGGVVSAIEQRGQTFGPLYYVRASGTF